MIHPNFDRINQRIPDPLTTMATTNQDFHQTTQSTLMSAGQFVPGQLSPDKIKVLIPQAFNGPFYYPPCKCDLVNQIRYFNPKTRDFYFHGMSPASTVDPSDKGNILVGEPEYYLYPTSTMSQEVMHDYINAYPHHHAVNHPNQFQGPYFPHSSFMPSGPYPIPVGPIETSGICEAILVSLALLLWLYSFYRLYSAWQRVLNFSEASIQGPQGWDLLVNWIMDRIQFKKLRLIHAIAPKKKQSPTKEVADGDEDADVDVDAIALAPDSPAGDKEEISPIEMEEGALIRTPRPSSSPRHRNSERNSQVYSSGHTSAAGSHKKVFESIFSLSDTDGYLSSNPCSVHLLQEGQRPIRAFHKMVPTSAQTKRAQRFQKQMSEDLPSYRTTTNTKLTTRQQWCASRQATTQVVDEEGIRFSSISVSEAYHGDAKRSSKRSSRASMPPLPAVIDMASMEDDTEA